MGQNDSGLFELSFHDERLVPFEFSSAVSRWRVELPPENNQFDLDTLSDLFMNLNYIAREGGTTLRQAASKSAQRRLPGDGLRFFDIPHEFPSLWSQAFAGLLGIVKVGKDRRHGDIELPLQLSRRSFPFLSGRPSVIVSQVHIFVDVDDNCSLGGHFTVYFRGEGDCPVETDIVCVPVSSDAEFYEGVLKDITLGPLQDDCLRTLGYLKFPQDFRSAHVRQAYFLCYYSTQEPSKDCHSQLSTSSLYMQRQF